jgi:hypothetical protein
MVYEANREIARRYYGLDIGPPVLTIRNKKSNSADCSLDFPKTVETAAFVPATVISPRDFPEDFCRIVNSGSYDTAWMHAMEVNPLYPPVRKQLDAITSVIVNGGSGICIADSLTLLKPRTDPTVYESDRTRNLPSIEDKKRKRECYRKAQQEDFYNFMLKGGRVKFTNPPGPINRFIKLHGRNHMKSSGCLDSQRQGYVWLGGCNQHENGLSKNADFMVRFNDPRIVQAVAEVTQRILEDNFFTSDRKITVTDQYDLLIDAGQPGRSLIQKEAYSLINDRRFKKLYLTSQLPLDPVTQILFEKRLKEGTEIFILLSNEKSDTISHSRASKLLHSQLVALTQKYAGRLHLFHSPNPNQHVHAKLLMGETEDGDSTAIFGSNNYFILGALLNTAEMNLLSRDQQLNLQMKNAFHEMVKGTWV